MLMSILQNKLNVRSNSYHVLHCHRNIKYCRRCNKWKQFTNKRITSKKCYYIIYFLAIVFACWYMWPSDLKEIYTNPIDRYRTYFTSFFTLSYILYITIPFINVNDFIDICIYYEKNKQWHNYVSRHFKWFIMSKRIDKINDELLDRSAVLASIGRFL